MENRTTQQKRSPSVASSANETLLRRILGDMAFDDLATWMRDAQTASSSAIRSRFGGTRYLVKYNDVWDCVSIKDIKNVIDTEKIQEVLGVEVLGDGPEQEYFRKMNVVHRIDVRNIADNLSTYGEPPGLWFLEVADEEFYTAIVLALSAPEILDELSEKSGEDCLRFVGGQYLVDRPGQRNRVAFSRREWELLMKRQEDQDIYEDN